MRQTCAAGNVIKCHAFAAVISIRRHRLSVGSGAAIPLIWCWCLRLVVIFVRLACVPYSRVGILRCARIWRIRLLGLVSSRCAAPRCPWALPVGFELLEMLVHFMPPDQPW